jgi:hypothetical protein
MKDASNAGSVKRPIRNLLIKYVAGLLPIIGAVKESTSKQSLALRHLRRVK